MPVSPPTLAHDLAAGDAISQYRNVADFASRSEGRCSKRVSRMLLRGTWIFYTVLSALGLIVSFGIKRTVLRRRGGEE